MLDGGDSISSLEKVICGWFGGGGGCERQGVGGQGVVVVVFLPQKTRIVYGGIIPSYHTCGTNHTGIQILVYHFVFSTQRLPPQSFLCLSTLTCRGVSTGYNDSSLKHHKHNTPTTRTHTYTHIYTHPELRMTQTREHLWAHTQNQNQQGSQIKSQHR